LGIYRLLAVVASEPALLAKGASEKKIDAAAQTQQVQNFPNAFFENFHGFC